MGMSNINDADDDFHTVVYPSSVNPEYEFFDNDLNRPESLAFEKTKLGQIGIDKKDHEGNDVGDHPTKHFRDLKINKHGLKIEMEKRKKLTMSMQGVPGQGTPKNNPNSNQNSHFILPGAGVKG